MRLIAHMGIWAHHGDADPTVPVAGSRNMMKSLVEAGGKPYFTDCDFNGCRGPAKSKVEDTVSGRNPPRHVYSEYQGLDHGLWFSAYAKYEGLVKWLFTFSKEAGTTAMARQPHRPGSHMEPVVGRSSVFRKGHLRFDPAGRRVPPPGK
jgi:hypothetical protein